MTLILVADDMVTLAEQYAYDLRRLGRYETLVAKSGAEALEHLASEPVDCMILDLEMPGLDGFDVLREMAAREIRVPVIVYTGTGSYGRCVQAVKLGAYGFIDKRESMERVVQEVERALEHARLSGEVASLRRRLDADSPLVGSSPAMLKLREAMTRIAPVPSPVLVLGESGVGKELVARDLHRLGPHPKGTFLALNCAALPEHLVESELFGHERGAFTGASTLRRGAFEHASGGTLFLDEIGDLPLAAQAKFLRVLEQREVTRVGGTRTIRVDPRVVAATHRDLSLEVNAGRFREDLFYRLNVHPLTVPPLRERLSDLPELAAHLLDLTCERYGIKPKTLSAEAVERLMAYHWRRNNVRELRNVIERMVIASETDTMGPQHVPAEILAGGAAPTPLRDRAVSFQDRKAEAERRIVIEALERNQWHITRTAEELGLADHASLLKIMRRLEIQRG